MKASFISAPLLRKRRLLVLSFAAVVALVFPLFSALHCRAEQGSAALTGPNVRPPAAKANPLDPGQKVARQLIREEMERRGCNLLKLREIFFQHFPAENSWIMGAKDDSFQIPRSICLVYSYDTGKICPYSMRCGLSPRKK
jgi:hypothetical protein